MLLRYRPGWGDAGGDDEAGAAHLETLGPGEGRGVQEGLETGHRGVQPAAGQLPVPGVGGDGGEAEVQAHQPSQP